MHMAAVLTSEVGAKLAPRILLLLRYF